MVYSGNETATLSQEAASSEPAEPSGDSHSASLEAEAEEPLPTPTSQPEVDLTPDLESLSEISERDLAIIARDPDAHTGENYIVYGHVTQFDPFTGRCGLRMNSSEAPQAAWYDYEHNTILVSGDFESECPEFDEVLQDDEIKVWVTIGGAYDYKTTLGGSAVAIYGIAWKVELL